MFLWSRGILGEDYMDRVKEERYTLDYGVV